MKTYKSHKEVKAAKITEVLFDAFDGTVRMFLQDSGMRTFRYTDKLFARHTDNPLSSLAGDYLVEYEDGYLSLSPAKAFEEGYHLAPVPRMDANAIEAEINAKGLNAPRITPAMIDETVRNVEFHVFGGTTLTVCVLTLWNGFTVTGESACASPANYDRELGEKIALQNAKQKIWALEGYRLRSFLHGTAAGSVNTDGMGAGMGAVGSIGQGTLNAALAHKESVLGPDVTGAVR